MTLGVIHLRLIRVGVLLFGLVLFGSIGYVILEGGDFADGFYMTVITLSTVGYGETRELTQYGRWFTSILICLCVVGMTCWTAALTSFLIDIDLGGNLLRRRMVQVISKLAGHTIVCGSNQMAEVVIERLTRKRKKVVVVDEDKDRLAELQKRYRRIMTIEGAATNELNLADANVLSAANVVAALPSDLDNLLIAITCRDLNEEIAVYAESNDLTVANRMRKAGVDRVVNPSQLCGMHVSDQILSP